MISRQPSGVYAMAVPADDWPENRQTCVDVLCGYLRMPYEPDPGGEAALADRAAYRANREVRHTIIRLIGAHLREGALASWQGLNLDLTGVAFDGGDFRGAEFTGGEVRFDKAQLTAGQLGFRDTRFIGGLVSFRDAEFTGGTVDFRQVAVWKNAPEFDWDSTPPPGVSLPVQPVTRPPDGASAAAGTSTPTGS